MFQDGQLIHPLAEDTCLGSGPRGGRSHKQGAKGIPLPEGRGIPHKASTSITHRQAVAFLSSRLASTSAPSTAFRKLSVVWLPSGGKRRFVRKGSGLTAVTKGPPCLCIPPRYHRGGMSVREGQGSTPPAGEKEPTTPQDIAVADGLRSALLHCNSFRYFHSPCGVLCTFRLPYLCNIG